MESDIRRILSEMAKDLTFLARKSMEEVGTNQKVGKNTLLGSRLYREIETDTREDMIEMLFNQYIEYIERRRPPKYGKRPPVNVIIDWMKRKNIPPRNGTIRQVAWLISRAIWRDGHEARPVIATLIEKANIEWDEKWSQQIFEGIIKELDNQFRQ